MDCNKNHSGSMNKTSENMKPSKMNCTHNGTNENNQHNGHSKNNNETKKNATHNGSTFIQDMLQSQLNATYQEIMDEVASQVGNITDESIGDTLNDVYNVTLAE